MACSRRKTARILTLAGAALAALASGPSARAADSMPAQSVAEAPSGGGSQRERNFYQVLEDLMADFEYDLKNGNVSGLKNLSIRNIATSENIPPSFKSHLELVLTERILKTTKARVIQCLPCRSKRTTLNGDQVVITSPETNPVELSRIAKISGIENFLDLAFSYQPSGMVLSMYITEPESGGVVWSRSYNSETSRAAAFRRGVDYSQIDDARKQTEYTPTIQYRASVMYLFEKDISGSYTGCLGLGFRMVERYDNRKKEVGFELDYLLDASTIVSPSTTTPTTPTTMFSGLNLTLLFMHAWNMIGEEENFNKVRGSLFVGAGGTFATGSTSLLGGLIRAGYEWRLAKHWAISGSLGYRPKATAFVTTTGSSTATSTPISGMEFGLGISGLF